MSDIERQTKKKTFLGCLRKINSPGRHLRQNQIDIISSIQSFLESQHGVRLESASGYAPAGMAEMRKEHDLALIESSPGSGKTRVMGALASAASNSDLKVLVLTPRLALNDQTMAKFIKETGIPKAKIGVFDSNQAKSKKEKVADKPILVATQQSLPTLLEQGIISFDPSSPRCRGLVIVDEAHEFYEISAQKDKELSVRDRKALSAMLERNGPMALFFTGTDDGVGERLFQGRLPTIYSKRLVQAIDEGLLCQARAAEISVVPAPEENDEEVKELRQNFSEHPSVVKAAVDQHFSYIDSRMGAISKYKTIFFVDGIKAAKVGAALYNSIAQEKGEKLQAAFLSYKTPPQERKKILKDYEEGRITALFNDNILGMGFDDPETAIIHDLKQGNPENLREWARLEQRGTRACRLCPAFQEKHGIPKEALLFNYRFRNGDDAPEITTYHGLLAGEGRGIAASSQQRSRPRSEKRDTDEKTLPQVTVTAHIDYLSDLPAGTRMAFEEAIAKPAKTSGDTPQYQTADSRAYIPLGSVRLDEERRHSALYSFLYRELKAMKQDAEKRPTWIPWEEAVKDGEKRSQYLHPDFFAELKESFLQNKRDDVLTSPPQEYKRMPLKADRKMHKYFSAKVRAAEKEGHYTVKTGPHAGKEIEAYLLVRSVRAEGDGGQPSRYLHPDLYNDIYQSWLRQEEARRLKQTPAEQVSAHPGHILYYGNSMGTDGLSVG